MSTKYSLCEYLPDTKIFHIYFSRLKAAWRIIMSIIMDFNDSWLFHDGEINTEFPATKGPVYIQAKTEEKRRGPASYFYDDRPDDFGAMGHELTHERWEQVTLPHDYIFDSAADENENNALGYYKYRAAWYRKHFRLDDSFKDKKIEIEFCGVANECDAYVNGVFMRHNGTSYVPFMVDITDFAKFGEENVIALHVTTENFEGWWYNGGGIFRDVRLCVSEKVHIEKYGVYLCPRKLGKGSVWRVDAEVSVENSGFVSADAFVRLTVYDPDGNFAASAEGSVIVDARDRAVLNLTLEAADPKLWDIDSPTLYRAETEVFVGGELCDSQSDDFGFRYFEFTPDNGFFLNGRAVFINGVCGHDDFGLTGRAVPDNIARYKVKLLKEMGTTGYRCSHYMYGEETMRAFDREGVLVMAETRHFSSAPVHIEELRTLVKRDRNHPSVILWSLGNEEPFFITDEGRRIAETLSCEVKKLDRSRPVMTANDKKPDICTVYGVSDIVAINYNLDIYDTVRKQIPDKAFISSECCASSTTRGWYYSTSRENGYISAYDIDMGTWIRSREYTNKFLRQRKYVAGAFQWTGIEYRGESTWPGLCSQSGAIDLFLQKKDAFYQNLSMWSDIPMIHILPHWNMESVSCGGKKPVRVWAYTNCPKVELFLNGKSLGTAEVERFGHAEWSVPFEAGELKAKGYSENGEVLAEDVKITAGRSTELRLRLENPDDIHANGKDIALYTCYCVDENGREVPNASPTVRFFTDGYGEIVGTGSDVTDHSKIKLPVRKMRAGRITVAVRVESAPGELVLYAQSENCGCDGLKTAVLVYDVK